MNRSANETLHGNVSDFIRSKIYGREWSPQQQIPSEHELMDTFGVSRGTVRKALKTLVDEGMVQQERGRGTFVSESLVEHPGGGRTFSFAESFAQRGISFTTAVLVHERIEANDEVAARLAIDPGEAVLRLRRVRAVHGDPIMVLDSWTPLSRCPGIDELPLERLSLYDAVERTSGKRIAASRMTYSARAAGKEVAALLGVPEGSPVLNLEQLISLEDGGPIEWSDTMLRAGQAITGIAHQAPGSRDAAGAE